MKIRVRISELALLIREKGEKYKGRNKWEKERMRGGKAGREKAYSAWYHSEQNLSEQVTMPDLLHETVSYQSYDNYKQKYFYQYN